MKFQGKYILIILLLLASVTLSIAQVDCRTILAKALIAYDQGDGDLEKALQYLQDTETCDYQNLLETQRQELQASIFFAIRKQKIQAEEATKSALMARDSATKSLKIADSLRLKVSETLVETEYQKQIADEAQKRESAHNLALQSIQLNPNLKIEKKRLALSSFEQFSALKTKDSTIFSAIYNALYSSYKIQTDSLGLTQNFIQNEFASIEAISFLSAGNIFFTAGRNGAVKKYAITQWQPPRKPKVKEQHLDELEKPRFIHNAMAANATDDLLAFGGWSDSIRLFDISSNKVKYVPAPASEAVTDLAFAQTNDLFISMTNGSIYILDVLDGNPKLWFKPLASPITTLSCVGQFLLAGDANGKLIIWDLHQGTQPKNPSYQIDLRPSGISAISASVSESTNSLPLAVGFEDGAIIVLDFQFGPAGIKLRGQREYHHHVAEISDLSFNKDGRLLGVGSFDKKASVLFLQSQYHGSPLLLDHFDSWPTAVEFIDEDRQFLVGTRSGRLQFYSLDLAVYAQALQESPMGGHHLPSNAIPKSTHSENSCREKYIEVERLYQQGNLRKTASYFRDNQDCLKTSFTFLESNTQRAQLAASMTEVYLFLGNEKYAQEEFKHLLNIDPFYPEEKKKSVPRPEIELWRKKFKVAAFNFGVKFGFNWSLISNTAKFSRLDVEVSKETFTPRRWNMHGSGFFGFRPSLHQPWEFLFEFHYTPRAFKYRGAYDLSQAGADLDQARLSFKEAMLWNNFLLAARYDFNIRTFNLGSQTNFYGLFGGGLGQLQRSDFEILDISFANNSDQNRKLGALEISNCPEGQSLRKSKMLLGLIGLGIKYRPAPRIFFFSEIRYDFTLQNIINTENRYNCTQLVDDFLYVDNDMLVHTFYLSAGAFYQIYWPSVKRARN